MEDAPDRGSPSNLRGWLSEVYLTALASSDAEQLTRRLGDRATVDDPIFGRSSGMPALGRYLETAAAWLAQRGGTFDKVAFTTGSDRDVTEGTLGLTIEGRRVAIPVAIVAERRPEREVEIRLYHSTKRIDQPKRRRPPLVSQGGEVIVPPPVAAHLDALARGDVAAIIANFENGGELRDALDERYVKVGSGGPLRDFYERRLAPASSGGPNAGIGVLKAARADDGSTCVLEYTVVRLGGEDIEPEAGLAVYERGESGLLRGIRLYDDLGA